MLAGRPRYIEKWGLKMSLKFKILLTNSIISVMLIIMCGVTFYGISELHSANYWVNHTHKVIEKSLLIEGAAVDMETGMRGFLLAGKDEFLEPYNGGRDRFNNLIKDLKNTVSDNPPQVARLTDMESNISEWQDVVVEPAIAFRREVGATKSMDAVVELVGKALGKKYFDKFRSQIKGFRDIESNLMLERQKEEEFTYSSTMIETVIITIFSLILSIFLSIYLSNSVAKPLKKIFGGLKKFSSEELNYVQEIFNKITKNLRIHAQELNDASYSIGTSSGTLIDNTSHQGSSIEETSASIHQIASLIKNNSDEANKTSNKITEIKDEVTHLHSMFNKIEESNHDLKKLVDIIQNIGEKTNIIDDIVFQTKLLSFNASVEAERAGEHGRGFAVVAQEVANLASISGKSSVEISNIVKNGIKSCESLVNSNVSRVEKASESMRKVAEWIDVITTASHEIASSSSEQSKGIDQVNEAMHQIHRSTESTTLVANSVDESCQGLYTQAETISEIVSNLDALTLNGSLKYTSNVHIEPKKKSENLKSQDNVVQISNFEGVPVDKKVSQGNTDGWEAI